MIRLMNIHNVEKFLKLTEETRGDVMIHFNDGTQCSLRDNETAREMLRVLPVHNADIRLSLTDANDLPLVMEFMMEDCA